MCLKRERLAESSPVEGMHVKCVVGSKCKEKLFRGVVFLCGNKKSRLIERLNSKLKKLRVKKTTNLVIFLWTGKVFGKFCETDLGFTFRQEDSCVI